MQHEKLQRTTYFICVLFTFRKALRPVFATAKTGRTVLLFLEMKGIQLK